MVIKCVKKNCIIKLSLIAPTVFAKTLRGSWVDNFTLYAKALGKEQEGENLLKKFNNRIKKLSKKYKDLLNLKISVIRFLPNQTRIYMKK